MSTAHERSAAWVAAARAVVPGGAHTYARGDDQYPEGRAPVLERGLGCHVWDVDGNEYVEYGSGLRSVVLGHAHAAVLAAVQGSLPHGSSFVRPHRLELQAAERMLALVPHLDMVKFGVSGSDATSAAVRLARAYTGRDVVAVCGDQPFFSTDDWFIGTTAMPSGVPDAVRGLTTTFPFNDLPAVAEMFRRQPVAALVLEAETTEPPAPGYLAGLRRLCDEHGVVLVLDEIITGFRWHLRGAQHVHDVRPDLATFGKGMANGFPVSALAGRADIMRLGGFPTDRDRVFVLSQTYGAQPWVLAALLATIEVFEQEDVAAGLHRTGAALRREVGSVVLDAGLQDHVQVVGRDCNLVFVTRDERGERSQDFRTLLLDSLLDGGVLAPSFVVNHAHDQAALDRTVAAVAAALPRYARALESGPAAVLAGRPVRPALRRRG